jgi:hypothetical protein
MNIPMILHNWSEYAFYLSKEYVSYEFIYQIISKMLQFLNLYDLNWTKYCELSNDENLFWENYKNKII